MGLNVSRGNMYSFVTHTWNTVKGECPHGCTYCYMHRWGKQKPVRFDQKELKTDLGTGNFIFVGSSCDLFADDIPKEWIMDTLAHCKEFDNFYLFQTKNPSRVYFFEKFLPPKSSICTTLESDIFYPDIMKSSPTPNMRALSMLYLSEKNLTTYITIEPIMDFNLEKFVNLIKLCKPAQVNLGADSGDNHLPEPTREDIEKLIQRLSEFTIIHNKSNLKRLLK